MMDRVSIKLKGKERFKKQYGTCIGAIVIFFLVIFTCGLFGVLIPGATLLVSVCITPIVSIGFNWFFLKVYRDEIANISDLFVGFNNFGHNIGGYLWMTLWIFLWTLLLYIPGLIKSISYSMTPYILMDQPEIGACDALKLSMEMTKGHKMEIFIFYLSFIGWGLLSFITIGLVGFFFATPYQCTSLAGIYEELKGNTYDKEIITESYTTY